METPVNRQTKRGRPTAAEVETRLPPVPELPVELPVAGMVCPCCGRAMVPRRLKTLPQGSTYNKCSMCGGTFRRYLGEGGSPMLQVLVIR